MLDDHPILLAVLTGFVSGFIISIPVGPVNLTIMNEGARRGFRWALLIALGATLMEVIYCAIAFTGFSSMLGNRMVKAAMEVFSFAFLLYLGIRFLVATSVPKAPRIEQRIEERLHPHSAFMTGFVRVMANPGVLVFWIILAASFISREWVEPTLSSRMACVAGMAVGTAVWFVGLSWAVSLGHKRYSEKTLVRMERISGVLLILLATGHGANLIWQLTRARLH